MFGTVVSYKGRFYNFSTLTLIIASITTKTTINTTINIGIDCGIDCGLRGGIGNIIHDIVPGIGLFLYNLFLWEKLIMWRWKPNNRSGFFVAGRLIGTQRFAIKGGGIHRTSTSLHPIHRTLLHDISDIFCHMSDVHSFPVLFTS
jgi:hypothetical protein